MKFMTHYFRLFLASMFLPMISFAEEAAHAVTAGGHSDWIAPGAGFAMGIAVLGAALGQARIASAFMEGTARNPASAGATRTMLILSLIFVETLVLFAFLVAYLLVGKV